MCGMKALVWQMTSLLFFVEAVWALVESIWKVWSFIILIKFRKCCSMPCQWSKFLLLWWYLVSSGASQLKFGLPIWFGRNLFLNHVIEWSPCSNVAVIICGVRWLDWTMAQFNGIKSAWLLQGGPLWDALRLQLPPVDSLPGPWLESQTWHRWLDMELWLCLNNFKKVHWHLTRSIRWWYEKVWHELDCFWRALCCYCGWQHCCRHDIGWMSTTET